MSGHSKWATIKRKKEKTDSQRGKVFTKLGRELAIAVREGGADPNTNGKLRDAVAKAKANNMPNDTIARSIKKAAGEAASVQYEEIVYEGYGTGGVAIIVEAVTDNRNRTAAEIRYIFDKNGGSLGATGCVAWMFERAGVIAVERTDAMDEDEMLLIALEAGAQDMLTDGDVFEIRTAPADFSAVREAIEAQGIDILSAQIERLPQNTVEPAAGDALDSILKILDMLDDHDDVQDVYHNALLPQEEDEDD